MSPADSHLQSTKGRNVELKEAAPADQRFGEVITTEQELSKIVGPANRWFTSKILHRLDRSCRNFIAASPFVVVGSTNPHGMVDLSPKGDRAGFVRFLDDTTLATANTVDGRDAEPATDKQPRHQKLSHGLPLFTFPGTCRLPKSTCCDCLVAAREG